MIAGLLRSGDAQFAGFVRANVRAVAAAGVGDVGIVVSRLAALVGGETEAVTVVNRRTADAQRHRERRAAVVGQWAEFGIDIELIARSSEAAAVGSVPDQIVALTGNRARAEHIGTKARTVGAVR